MSKAALQKKKKKSTTGDGMVEHSPKILTSDDKATTTRTFEFSVKSTVQKQIHVLKRVTYRRPPPPFHPRVTAVARKRPRSCSPKCRWQVTPRHAYTVTQRSRSGLIMPLSRHSVGTYLEMSSHATGQGILGHSRLSSLSHCGLILAYRVELVCAS